MNTCKNCQHWKKKDQPWNDDIYGRCFVINEADGTIERSVIAYVSDCMEGNTHFFHTRSDFGCVLFKDR